TPELLEAGRVDARRRGAELAWQEADAEALPFADAEFDTVISCVGVMFAPHHQRAADEMVRVTRPGGTIGLISWTPQGFIGRMFGVMKPYAAPPPAGAQPPPLWGDAEHVRELLGDRITDMVAERRILDVDRFLSGAEFRDFFKATYGPTIAVYQRLAAAGDTVGMADLDRALAELGDEYMRPDTRVMEWEYLLLTARRS
ncbi:MAG TPA: class I SAM-dependent methyltransferase, partial [Jiangellales bacterium]|nr:class I SAM-dependent methyltransferase [Jiangellales bacterium]